MRRKSNALLWRASSAAVQTRRTRRPSSPEFELPAHAVEQRPAPATRRAPSDDISGLESNATVFPGRLVRWGQFDFSRRSAS